MTTSTSNASQNGRPTPKFAVGDWAFNNSKGHNARVVSVVWDQSLNGFNGGWRYQTPGLSSPNMYGESPGAPYVQYRQINEHCWKEVGPCSRDDQNIQLAEVSVATLIEQREAVMGTFSVNVFLRGRYASYLIAAHHGILAASAAAAVEAARMFYPPKAVGLCFEAVGGAA